MLLPILIIATCLRIPGLTDDPPGFSRDEATVALAARQIERESFPVYFTDENNGLGPAFPYIVNVVGQLAGWGTAGPRLAAALLGIAATIACSLWYRQMFGHGWALAGGLLIAASFWQIVFSRQADPAISMAAAGSVGLWALWKAAESSRRRGRKIPSGWFGVAGFAFGLGIYTDVSMRAAVPVALLIGIFIFYKKDYLGTHSDRRGLLLGLIAMLLVAAPLASYFWEHPDVFRLGVSGSGGFPSVDDVASTFGALVWSGTSDWSANIAGRSLLDPILAVWAVAGFAVALRHPLRARHAWPLIWFLGFVVAVIVVAPGDHAQLLALTPVLFLFPLRGMRELVRVAGERTEQWRRAALALVVLSIIGSAAWSMHDYYWEWAPHPETYRAFHGDVREAVEEIAALPPDGIVVYFSTGAQGRIVRYLSPDRPRRDFRNPATVPIPAEGPAYLIAPASADIKDPISVYLGEERIIATGFQPDGERAYRMWFVDDRTRDSMPYAVPAAFFAGGYDLLGYAVRPHGRDPENPEIDLVLVVRAPVGSQPVRALARFVVPGDDPSNGEGVIIRPAPDSIAGESEIFLARIGLSFPTSPMMIADLHMALQTLDGDYLAPSGPGISVIGGTHVLLNAIGYIIPAP